MAIKANFTAGVLSVTGDNGDDAIAITRNAGGQILINGSAQGATLTNTNEIEVFGGNGNDTFIWNPGDGNDTVDGQAGFDTLEFFGKNSGETFSIDPNDSGGATFTRTNGTIDLTSVERIQFDAQGQSADNITINDLTGTGV